MRRVQWVQIEPTKACNLKCVYCARTLVYGNAPHHMDKALMEKIIGELKKLPNLRQILLQGFGEPLLYPYLLDSVRLIRQEMPQVSVQLVTNGMVMHRSVHQIMELTDVLYISIDSLEPEYWNKVRVGGNLDKIIGNISDFKEANPNLDIVMNSVVSADTLDQIEPLCSFADRMALAGIQFIPLYPLEGVSGGLTAEHWRHLADEMKRMRKRYGGIRIYSPFDVRESAVCPWVSNGLYVLYDGKVTPCCVMSSDDDVVYGDLSNQSMEQLFASETRQSFTKTYKTHERCEECNALSFNRIWNFDNPLPLMRRSSFNMSERW